AADGGRPQQVAVAPDGTRSTPSYAEKAPYLVLTKDWFQKAMAGTDVIIWRSPYQFITGGLGITAYRVLRLAGAQHPIGAFEVDLRLEAIAGFLSGLQIGRHGAVFLVHRDGRRIVSPIGDHVAAAEGAVDAAAARRARRFGSAPERVAVGGRSYEIVFAPFAVSGDLG